MKMWSSISVTRKYASLFVHSSSKHAKKLSRQDVYLMFSEKRLLGIRLAIVGRSVTV